MKNWTTRFRLSVFFWFESLGPFLPRDVFSIALASILLVILTLAAVYGSANRAHFNYGFGNDWVCSYPGRGDPVCVKRVSDQSPPSLKN